MWTLCRRTYKEVVQGDLVCGRTKEVQLLGPGDKELGGLWSE
jgi:hypothetical protein